MSVTGDIVSITGSPVKHIVLRLRELDFCFSAGQYLEVLHPDGGTISLSIASAPARLPELHLYYRSTPGIAEAEMLDELLADSSTLTLRGPAGSVCVAGSLASPLLLVAGGTGAAQALAIIDDQLSRAQDVHDPFADAAGSHAGPAVDLLVCADDERELIHSSLIDNADAPWLNVTNIVDKRRDANNKSLKWLAGNAARFAEHRIIVCGSPGFVYAVEDVLLAAGINGQQIESDVHAYAPRSPGG